ncbi:MAG: FAD-dependent oxidoreductase [Magnetococcales bacterium]|nr:FAD-dependent oxidoreductase [Magnetococcales bacterium]
MSQEPINITLNGQELCVSANATIREVAEQQGIHIPTFCHNDRLKPFASCFLCVVEVEKARTLLPACSTRVVSGMNIKTDSEIVRKSRRGALDLLLSDHAGDCVAPCETTCPAHIDIQGYIAHIANGEFEAAVHLIKRRNPLPVVCGRICPHPCESECRRALVDDEPVAINPLKRFASEYELQMGAVTVPRPLPDTGRRVAIIGGGPAGLSAAYYLRLMGHQPEIFEALPQLGGMARYGIPRFRLPWEMMDREIQAILDLGVPVHYQKKLGRDFSMADLKKRGFSAVLLAIGAHKSRAMGITNENAPGVMGGIDFLRGVVLGEEIKVGHKVAVIGGGDTAMDCARVAKRLGAEVTLLYRRTQAEMPSMPQEQHEAIEEGILIRYLTAPVGVLLDTGGHACGLKVITMELGEPDKSGRRRPVPKPNSEEILPFDLILAAIGQDPDLDCLDMDADKPDISQWKTFIHDEKTQVTSMTGVFAAGDCAFGPDILIQAIGEGRRAAQAIDLYLNGAEVKLIKEYIISRGHLAELEKADFAPRFVHKKRQLEVTLPPQQRLNSNGGWDAINVGFSEAQALAEASRCIECGCNARFDCRLRHYSTEYDAIETRFAGQNRKYAEDKRHPLIRIEADKCITCASCVRICSEVRQIHALSFISRGFTTQIGPSFGDPLQETGCDACGMCIDVCPTGALAPNTGKEAGPWIWDTVITSCTSCSRGCGLSVKIKNQRIVKINGIEGDPVNEACICAEGRFAYQMLFDQDNTSLPDLILERLSQLTQTVLVVVATTLTVEESFAAALVARQYNAGFYYMGSNGFSSPTKPNAKLIGEANVALLQRLGALPLREDHADRDQCWVLAIGCEVPEGWTGMSVAVADPLMTEGSFLNRDGHLVRLIPAWQKHGLRQGWQFLSHLAGAMFSDITTLRQHLVAEVKELTPLLDWDEHRLVSVALPVRMEPVAQDVRSRRFSAHMLAMQLSWE